MSYEEVVFGGLEQLHDTLKFEYSLKLLTKYESSLTIMQAEAFSSLKEKLESYINLRQRLQSHLDEERRYLQASQIWKRKFDFQLQRLNFVMTNMPKHCPYQLTNNDDRDLVTATPSGSKRSRSVVAQTPVNGNALQSQTKQSSSVSSSCPPPRIQYLSIPEFESVPKYIKVRLTRERLNELVDILNGLIQEKYRILRMPPNKLNNDQKTRFWAFKESETESIKGKFYVTEVDLKNSNNVSSAKAPTAFKLDSTGRNVLSILRHCGRIKEVRGGGHIRYVIQE